MSKFFRDGPGAGSDPYVPREGDGYDPALDPRIAARLERYRGGQARRRRLGKLAIGLLEAMRYMGPLGMAPTPLNDFEGPSEK